MAERMDTEHGGRRAPEDDPDYRSPWKCDGWPRRRRGETVEAWLAVVVRLGEDGLLRAEKERGEGNEP